MARQPTLIQRAISRANLRHGVAYVSGWQTRGSSSFNPRGVVVHHDASNRSSGDNGALNIIIHGRRDLPGPLSQFQLARSGRLWVVAAGRANHAGSGGWRGLSGNSSVFGIEAANDGRGEPWSSNMLDTYYRIVNALLAEMRQGTIMACAHKEWTARKPDPAFLVPGMGMTEFRAKVANAGLEGNDPEPKEEEEMYRFMKTSGDNRIYAVGSNGYGWHLTPTEFKELQDHVMMADNRVWEVSALLLQGLTGGAFKS